MWDGERRRRHERRRGGKGWQHRTTMKNTTPLAACVDPAETWRKKGLFFMMPPNSMPVTKPETDTFFPQVFCSASISYTYTHARTGQHYKVRGKTVSSIPKLTSAN